MRKSFRIALSVPCLAGLLLLPGCQSARIRGRVHPPPAEPAPQSAPVPATAAGKPGWNLSLGAPAALRPAARPPATPYPPFSFEDEMAGKWLVFFELSYPALATTPGAP
jgi:hypothetical protein